MASNLHSRLIGALGDRQEWEQRQRVWYEMRRGGLRRRRKPYANAADLHLALCNNAVEKLKPFYVNAIFTRQQLASFTPLRQQLADANAAAAQCLDYKLRKESNFPLQMGFAIDRMLLRGRGILKLRWDVDLKRLSFESVDPVYFIVPKDAQEIDEMDWFCHVRHLSVDAYNRQKIYNSNAELVARIKGGEAQVEEWAKQEKDAREGMTHSANEERIILWETYTKTSEGYRVSTYSPSAPDEPVRPDFILPYRGREGAFAPFVSFPAELTDQGWYAPRGIVELVAPYESYAKKQWDSKSDWLDFTSKPLFTRDPGAPVGTHNRENFRLRPGELLPDGVKPASLPTPPFSLDEEINFSRQLGEESAQVPDFGVQSGEQNKEGRTATEWNYIGSFASQGIQFKGWLHAIAEGLVYQRSWSLLVQFGGRELSYLAAEDRKVLPPQALHDNYLVTPDASPDAWNKTQRVQRSIARYQMFAGNPNVNQENLVKSVLEDDDPRLVKNLFISSGNKAANEAEDEAMEIAILERGFPAQAMPGENHEVRLRILAGYLQKLHLTGAPVDPIARQRLQEHFVQHLQLLKQENPALAKQFMAAIAALDDGGGGQGGSAAAGGPGMPGGGAGRMPGRPVQPMGSQGVPGGMVPLPGQGGAPEPALPMAMGM